MARTAIPTDVATTTGIIFAIDTAIDSTNGMSFTNTGREILLVENTHVSNALTVTLDYAADEYGRTGTKTVSVAASTKKIIGPFLGDLYNQDSSGTVNVDFSVNTGNVCLIKVKL